MDRKTRILLHALILLLMVLVASCLAGCAFAVGGARAQVPMPWSDPIYVDGSTGVNSKHGSANGATLPQAAGNAVQTPDGACGGTADQIVFAGANVSTDKATDVGAQGGMGNQQTKGSGVTGSGGPGTVEGTGGNTATPTNTANVPMTGQGAASVGGLSQAQLDALRTAVAADVVNALRAAGVVPATP